MQERHFTAAKAELGSQRPVLVLLNLALFGVVLIAALWGDRAAILAPAVFGLVMNAGVYLEDQRKLSAALQRDAEAARRGEA